MQQKRLTQIKKRLTNTFHPTKLIVTDESHHHLGHPSAEEGKGHFTITITAKAFNKKTSLECHRLIYGALDDLMKTDIHALKIHATNES